MERQTNFAETIDTVADKPQLDSRAKKLLAFKAVDAWILKCCVKEFCEYSVKFISEHCLTGEPEVSEHAVHPDQLDRGERISGDEMLTMMNSESNSINEGTVYYDVRFNAVVPDSGEPVTLIINLEVQTVDKPGYELVSRGMYYCARMISEQYGTVFSSSHYEKIRKVYSIWICPSTPESRKNSIMRYHMMEEPILGEPYVKEKAYDLEEVVVLNLGEAESKTDSDILNLLNTLFSDSVSPEEKKRVFSEEYNITMTKEVEEEVNLMCNLSSAIERKGEAKGKFEMAVTYYKRGILRAEDAASDLGMTVAEFLEKAGQFEQEKSEKE